VTLACCSTACGVVTHQATAYNDAETHIKDSCPHYSSIYEYIRQSHGSWPAAAASRLQPG
jgi:hypothetical protein